MINYSKELVDFLKERSILKVLEKRVLGGISQLFEEIPCGPGHIVFHEGDEADAIYIIRSGAVEVIRGDPPKVIAYLTAGDCFGEMALLHGTSRSATIRVPEEAVVLRLPREAFEELQRYFPEVTTEVTEVINRRLSGKLPYQSPVLQGNLTFFDLPTVIQTIVNSRQTGTLSLRGRAGKLVAQVDFQQGKLVHASFMHLSGEQAFYELLSRNEPLDFVFAGQRELPPGAPVDRSLTSTEPTVLLLEAARRTDQLAKLLQTVGWPDAVFLQNAEHPEWSKLEGDGPAVARKIWLLLEVGLSVRQLTEKLQYDRFMVLSTLEEMRQWGVIRAKSAAAVQSPSQVAAVVDAVNAVTANLSRILDQDQMRQLLTTALREAAEKYPSLRSLRVHPETVTLDLRSATPEVSQSSSSIMGLEYLILTFLRRVTEVKKGQ